MKLYYDEIESPIGCLRIVMNERGELTELLICSDAGVEKPNLIQDKNACSVISSQLKEYFAGTRTTFDIKLAPKGTPFQRSVWDALIKIPYGSTSSYLDIANKLGIPGASRAVGRANATNPIAVVVPCHRVIGSNGKLTGYAYGLETKAKLLELEQFGLT